MSFETELQALIDKAPEAGFASYSYGKLSFQPMVQTWQDTDQIVDGKAKRKPVAVPYREGQGELKEGQDAAFEFTVGIREFNPALDFDFVRLVVLKKNKVDPQSKEVLIKTDWDEIVLPSLIQVFGANWLAEIRKGVYVQIEAVPQIGAKKTEGGKVYTTIKFIKVFASREECRAAHTAQFASRNVETGDTVTAPNHGVIPADLIEKVKQLIGSLGVENTLKALKGHPYGPYEAADLIAAAS